MAAAAARQDRLWSFAEAFYRSQGPENSGYATDAFLRATAEATPGLDVDRAFRERDDRAVLQTLAKAERAAGALAADHTPAFYLRKGDGRPRAIEPEALDAALAAR
jgi:protein-disulfide isomerase